MNEGEELNKEINSPECPDCLSRSGDNLFHSTHPRGLFTGVYYILERP